MSAPPLIKKDAWAALGDAIGYQREACEADSRASIAALVRFHGSRVH